MKSMTAEVQGAKPKDQKNHIVRPSILALFVFVAAIASAINVISDPAQESLPMPASAIPFTGHEVERSSEFGALNNGLHSLGDYIANRWQIDPTSAKRVVILAERAAKSHDVDLLLVLAVVARESAFKYSGNHFDMTVNSPATDPDVAHGLMQVAGRHHPEKMPIDSAGRRRVTTDQENVQIGTKILSEYISREDGNIARALQRYNGNLSDAERRFSSYVLRVREDFEKVVRRS